MPTQTKIVSGSRKIRQGKRRVVLWGLVLVVLCVSGCGRKGPLKPLKPNPPRSSLHTVTAVCPSDQTSSNHAILWEG